MSAPKARFVLAAVVACLLTACGSDSDSPATADPAASDRALRGTTWTVTEVVGGETPVDPAAAQASLLIAEDGAVTGSGGCNRLIGTAAVREDSPTAATVDFRVGATRMMCEPERMAVEDAVLAVLGDDTAAAISGDTLTLTAGDGRGLVLVAD